MYRPLSGLLCVDGDIKSYGSSKIYTSIRKWDDLGYLFPLLPAHWSPKALRPRAHSQMMSLSFPKMWQGSLGQSVVVRNKLFQCWNPPRSVTIPFRIGAIHTQCLGVASSSPTWEAQGCRAAWSMLPSSAALSSGRSTGILVRVSLSHILRRYLLWYHCTTEPHAATKGKKKARDVTGVTFKGLNRKEQVNITLSIPFLG